MNLFCLLAITLVFCSNVVLCETLNKSLSTHFEKDDVGSCGSPGWLPKEDSYNYKYSSEEGTLTVYNIPVPPYCPSAKYEVYLYVNRSECYSAETCSCSQWGKFTPYTSSKMIDRNRTWKSDGQDSNESCSSSTKCSHDLVKTPTEGSFNVTFSDVFSGFYCVKIATAGGVDHHSRDYYPLTVRPFVVNSSKPIHDPRCYLPLMFEINLNRVPLQVVLVMNKNCSDSQFFYNSQFILSLKSASLLNSQLEMVECHNVKASVGIFSQEFRGLKTGNYSLEISRLECRCKSTTFRAKERCRKYEDYLTIVPGKPDAIPTQDDLLYGAKNILLISLTCSIALIFSIFISVMLYVKRQFFFPRITDSSTSWTDNELPTIVKVTNTVPVLLLCAMDNTSLRGQVLRFRHILEKIGFCEVCDIFDNEMYDGIATYGETYITTLLARPEYQIIVVTSKLAVETQKSILGFADRHDDDKGPMFDLYVKALKAVMILASENVESYKRIHLVRFPSVTPPDEMVSFITPFRCYLVPRNLRTLLCHLHGFSDPEILEGNDGLWKECGEEWTKNSCAEQHENGESSEYLLAI